ncbi:Pentatricopeptide repeat-containing protein [Platanthera zijinensis]|uniref:Pentatricopeptide repeat-containing protein n=1 Tax=Platanthera zijinensis TaxID=2320716 RepID=A0AAP0BTC5_9ASPA
MQTRSSGRLFSTLSRNPSCSPRYLIHLLSFTRCSSTGSDRPSIGASKTDDNSEDFFIRNLSFGDEIKQEKADKPDLKPSSPIPGRPLRVPRGLDEPREDLFPDFNNKQQRMSRGRPNKPRPFPQKLKSESEGNRNSFDIFDQNASSSSADRSKEEDNTDGNVKVGVREEAGDRIGETLFQKLKLGELSGGGKKVPAPESPTEDADQIFKKMKQTGLIPNAVAMLDGLCKDGLVQEAMKLFGLMREKGTIPEVVIYTAVVEGFCKAAKFDDAKRIFRKMQKNGIVPNAFCYSVLIQGLCKGKKMEDAVEFSMEMVGAGHSLNGATFTGLVDVICKEKGVKEGEDLVRTLRERGYALDEKAIREHLDKKGPFSPMVWEAIFGKKSSQRSF